MRPIHGALLAATIAVSSIAEAAPLQWTLNNVVFSDGGTASGSFTYDASLNAYSAISITTTAGAAFGGWAYGGQAIDQPQTSTQLIAAGANSLTVPGSVLFALRFNAALTDAGGTRNLLAGTMTIPPQGSFEVVCAVAAACAAPPVRLVTSGSISAPVVPVPAAAVVFASALGVMALVRRRAA